MAYDATEQDVLMRVFAALLRLPTKDGGQKRARAEKPPWWRDDSHEAAIFSHLNKWKHGEKVDPDSGVHPLVHLAWRALAIAYQETFGQIEPADAGFRS
jgi:dATP/dGTP diphosphohydrolase